MPFISIVVPAYNEQFELPGCLRSIKKAFKDYKQYGRIIEYEIIVCDNNSSDRTSDIARSFGVHVVFEPVNQIARARNCGACHATGKWLLFIDADSRLHHKTLADLIEKIDSEKTAAGGCLVALENIPVHAEFTVKFWNLLSLSLKWAAGSFVFARTDVFHESGGFGTEWYAAEEIDLSQRLKKICIKKGLLFTILQKRPHISSGRKVRMYKHRDVLPLISSFLKNPRKTLQCRENLGFFYDNKREKCRRGK